MSGSVTRVLRDTLVYGLGEIVLKSTVLVTMPFYTRMLAPHDYGAWGILTTATGLLSALLLVGGDSAYARYFFEYQTIAERQRLTSTVLSAAGIWALMVVAIAMPGAVAASRWSFGTETYATDLALALITVPVVNLNLLCGQALRNQFQARMYSILNLIAGLATIALSLGGLIVLGWGLTGIMAGTLVAAITILPLRLWAIRDLLRPTFSRDDLQRVLVYGLPLVPLALAYWIFYFSDRYLLGKLSDLTEVGLYTVAITIAGLMNLAVSAIGLAWNPLAMRVFEDDPEAARGFFGRVLTYMMIGFGILATGLCTFAPELICLFASPAYIHAAPAIPPLALGLVAMAATQVVALPFSLMKKTWYFSLYAWAMAALNVLLNLVFIPHFGMLAAAWSTAVAMIGLTLAYAWGGRRVWPIAYEIRKLATIATVTTFFCLGTLVWSTLPAWVDPEGLAGLVLKVLYCALFTGLLGVGAVERRVWGPALQAVRGRLTARQVQ